MKEILTAEEIVNARIAVGMSQQQVADALHISLRPYQYIEAGERNMARNTRYLFWLAVEKKQQFDEFLLTLRS